MLALRVLPSASPYLGYTYAYPHKTAYRRLDPAVRLEQLWTAERREALFLYLHIPFCEMRCGFCNLFTQAQPADDFVQSYLEAIGRHARHVRAALPDARFARAAIGGGTPTLLEAGALDAVFDIAESVMGANLAHVPFSLEASPDTVTKEKMALAQRRGVSRVSLGVQTFIEAEAHAAGRPQRTAAVLAALGQIRDAGIPHLNIDLIYGLPGQSEESWLNSLQQALAFRPEEIYLYPLYVRPLTGLGRTARDWDDIRLACYRLGRDFLRGEGYEQVSMRMFRKSAAADIGPVYCCQEDGMVGLGCGARSYTRRLHYSSEYAVGAVGVREILAAYVARPEETFDVADFGFVLDDDEQRRRHVLQSLLQCMGLDRAAYRCRFGTDALDDLPILAEILTFGWAEIQGEVLHLTDAGLERSDAIGPWLYSDTVRQRMEGYAWR